jgi:hypothetical protein
MLSLGAVNMDHGQQKGEYCPQPVCTTMRSVATMILNTLDPGSFQTACCRVLDLTCIFEDATQSTSYHSNSSCYSMSVNRAIAHRGSHSISHSDW